MRSSLLEYVSLFLKRMHSCLSAQRLAHCMPIHSLADSISAWAPVGNELPAKWSRYHTAHSLPQHSTLLLRLRVDVQAVNMFLYMTPVGMGLPYCQTPQGKVAELRLELNSGGKKDKNNSAKKIALKKIVANMTMSNNDMVALFPDVVNCMQISSLEIKKMYVWEHL